MMLYGGEGMDILRCVAFMPVLQWGWKGERLFFFLRALHGCVLLSVAMLENCSRLPNIAKYLTKSFVSFPLIESYNL